MESSTSDEEVDFIRRVPVVMCVSPDSEETRPVTPPMDQNMKLNKSLGLVLSPQSPPYRRIRSIKLIESPRSFLKTRLDQPFTSTPTPSPSSQNLVKRAPRTASRAEGRSRSIVPSDAMEKLSVSNGIIPAFYQNPFTPGCHPQNSKKKTDMKRTSQRSFTFESDENESDGNESQSQVDVKKPRLSDFNTPRYQEEFFELEVIGTGTYGCVFKCLNRLNGVEYAVKRGLKPINNERIAHNEIYAHGVLEHPNIVRNYSNWTENDYVYIQNEYCNGGSLEELIKAGPLEEKVLRKVLEHVAQGLRFIHSKNLAHMDIKPGNILIHRGPRVFYKHNDCADEFCDDEVSNEETFYKIADLGHVTRLDEMVDVREGDCRYLPREILNDDYSNLTKADIFALGLTLFEAAGGGPLPKNGEEWHNIRDGKLKRFPHLSNDFNNQLKRMVHPNPDMRPSASDLLSQTSLSPIYKTVKDKHELKAAKQKIQVLEQQLEDVVKCVKVLRQTQTENKPQICGSIYKNNNTTYVNNNRGERLVGKKSKRSQSTTIF